MAELTPDERDELRRRAEGRVSLLPLAPVTVTRLLDALDSTEHERDTWRAACATAQGDMFQARQERDDAEQRAAQAASACAALRDALQMLYDQYGYDWRHYVHLITGMKLEQVERVLADDYLGARGLEWRQRLERVAEAAAAYEDAAPADLLPAAGVARAALQAALATLDAAEEGEQ